MNVLQRLSENRIFWFVFTGGVATLTHISVFVILVEFFQIDAVLASAPSYLTALAVSYYGNRTWTFKSTAPHVAEIPRYIIVAVSGLIMNVMITYLVVEIFSAPYGVALFLVVIAAPIVTYWLCRKWVFSSCTS